MNYWLFAYTRHIHVIYHSDTKNDVVKFNVAYCKVICLCRWCEVAPVPDMSADSVHKFLMQFVFLFASQHELSMIRYARSRVRLTKHLIVSAGKLVIAIYRADTLQLPTCPL